MSVEILTLDGKLLEMDIDDNGSLVIQVSEEDDLVLETYTIASDDVGQIQSLLNKGSE
jgi:hypothetical protein